MSFSHRERERKKVVKKMAVSKKKPSNILSKTFHISSFIIYTCFIFILFMTEASHIDLKQLLQAVQKGKPPLQCSSKHTVSHLCISRKCQYPASSCMDESCEECTNSHGECECVKISSFTKILKGLARHQKKITQQLVIITEEMIQEIKGKMKDYEDEVCLGYLAQQELEAISTIYLSESGLKMKGDQVKDLFRKVQHVQKEIGSLEEDLIEKFHKEAKIIAEQLNKIQDETFHEFRTTFKAKLAFRPPKIDPKMIDEYEELRIRCLRVDQLKHREKMQMLYSQKRELQQSLLVKTEEQSNSKLAIDLLEKQLSSSKEQVNLLISSLRQSVMGFTSLITKEFEDIKFLIDSLNKPKSFKLLFRASQHNFQSSKFHQLCDGKENTLTLIKTEFGKIIGGFTPLAWESKNPAEIVEDPSEKSFIFSISLHQKMPLHNTKKAICHLKDAGPMFGGEEGNSDIKIGDKCNETDKFTFANFSASYNINDKYKRDQQSKTALCGATVGCNFKVEEYEVFQVEW